MNHTDSVSTDDREACALDAISDDEDFQKSFCESHAWQLIELLETPDMYPTLLSARAKKLSAAWYKSIGAELKQRMEG